MPMIDDELIAHLCVRIGMIMEDVCGEAVMTLPMDKGDLDAFVRRLEYANERIARLLGAVRALADCD